MSVLDIEFYIAYFSRFNKILRFKYPRQLG